MIGNYVSIKGRYAKVANLGNGLIAVRFKDDNSFDAFYPSVVEPIKLTAKILTDNGFGDVDYCNDEYGEEIDVSLDFSDWAYNGNGERWPIAGYGYNLKYVHQLQNAITICDKKLELSL